MSAPAIKPGPVDPPTCPHCEPEILRRRLYMAVHLPGCPRLRDEETEPVIEWAAAGVRRGG